MKLIQCQKGHYYDSSRFGTCPYCEKMQQDIGVTVPLNRVMENSVTDRVMENPVKESQPEQTASNAEPQEAVVSSVNTQPQTAGCQTANGRTGTEQPSFANQWRAPQSPSGRQEFWQVPEDDNRTVSYYSKKIGTEPVVGWLVAISGEYVGESFKIKGGRNFIGRSPEMDIQLSMDLSVSRRKHAVLIYEPKSRQFIAQPGESRELFYLNEEVVLNNVIMKAYDVLTVGETKLLLIPLCGEKFSWDDLHKI